MPTDNNIRLTKHEEFSAEDWKDLHYTIQAFKLRVLRRHYGGGTDEETIRLARRFQRHRPRKSVRGAL